MSGVVSDDEEGSVTFSSTRKVVDCIPSTQEQTEEGSGTCNFESAPPLPKSRGPVKEIVLGKIKREEDTVAGIGDVPTGSAYKAVVKARAEAITDNESILSPMTPSRKHPLMETPETVIGPEVHMKGELSFRRLLRIDGSFTGKLSSTGDLIIGENGTLIGDLDKMGGVIIEGKIIGNINVQYLELKTNAVVHGNITCNSLAMGWGVKVVGKLNVHPDAPGELHPYPVPIHAKEEEHHSMSKEISKSSLRGLESRKQIGGQISTGKVKESEAQEPNSKKNPKKPGVEGGDDVGERNILEKEKRHSSKEKRKSKRVSKEAIQELDGVEKHDQSSLKKILPVQQEKERYSTSSMMPDDIVKKQDNEAIMAQMTHNEAVKFGAQAPEVAG